ncbi:MULTISPECIES: hypothetical protein [Pseudomonas]|uniref:hypothetical protein n=1 Tax=Pseudomonas TaxID=286 RepID=UPI0009EAD8E5|nr:hypothetical protein [Pseudomonas sp. NBRC 111121]
MRNTNIRSEFPQSYHQGHAARSAGKSKLSQPFGYPTVGAGWWLGGWNDRDMELELEKKNPPINSATQAA